MKDTAGEAAGTVSKLENFSRGRTLAACFISPAGVALLEGVSLFYILFPALIFFFGWLRWPLALALGGAILLAHLAGGVRAYRWAKAHFAGSAPVEAGMGNEAFFTRSMLTIAVSGLLAVVSGAGGLTFRFVDYQVYDGIIRALLYYPWPLGFNFDLTEAGRHFPGVYYFAHFLPAALAGLAWGWKGALAFNVFWDALGVMLTVLWFMRLVDRFRFRYVLLFLLFGGMDIIGYMATTPLPGSPGPGSALTWFDYLTGTFWWTVGRGYMAQWSANFSLLTQGGHSIMGEVFYRFYGPLCFLFDGPHHVLPEWIILLMGLHDVLRRRTLERFFLLMALLPLCSPLTTMGTVPLLFAALIHTRGKGLFTAGNMVLGPVLVGIVMAMYQSSHTTVPNGWLWEYQDISRAWPYLLLYYLSSFGVYVLVSPAMRGGGYRPGRLWFWMAVAVFLFAPWYRYGVYNDFTTKFIIPSQVVFILCLATSLESPAGRCAVLRKRLLTVALILGAWSACGIVYRSFEFGFSCSFPPEQRVMTVQERLKRYNRPDEQLLVDGSAFFWKHLARPVMYWPIPENPLVKAYDFTDEKTSLNEWTCLNGACAATNAGLEIKAEGEAALLRCDTASLDTRAIGSARLEHTVTDRDGNKLEGYSIILQWADEKDLWKYANAWPFHRWRSSVIVPEREPLAANSYWRGQARSICLYFKPEAGTSRGPYTVTLRRLDFFQR